MTKKPLNHWDWSACFIAVWLNKLLSALWTVVMWIYAILLRNLSKYSHYSHILTADQNKKLKMLEIWNKNRTCQQCLAGQTRESRKFQIENLYYFHFSHRPFPQLHVQDLPHYWYRLIIVTFTEIQWKIFACYPVKSNHTKHEYNQAIHKHNR